MLSIILGFVFFCLVVWCFFALAACGLLQIIVYAASVLIGIEDSCSCQHWITYVNTGSCLYRDPELDS